MIYVCEAMMISAVMVSVEADSIEDAKRKFKKGAWDDIDDTGGEVQEVNCDLNTVKLDDVQL